jgi:glycosyltransferase involved in cell wall biosynthesis
MHLAVQICALNEAANIATVIRSIPRRMPGIATVQVVVVDDGSSDGTADVARQAGADIVVRHTSNKGLARAFQTGMDTCLAQGADILVNIDADGQYPGEDIPALVQPILSGQADIVIGDRQVASLQHFSPGKRFLQKLGSWMVQTASGISIPDAVSGFRAYSRESALRLFVTSEFSYTVQTLIQAGKLGLAVASVPISARETTRPSRLHKGTLHFVGQQAIILLRTYVTYEPLKTFVGLSIPFLLLGTALLLRLILIAAERGGLTGNVQSLIVGVVSIVTGLLLLITGITADRIRENRRLLEESLYRIRRQETPVPAPVSTPTPAAAPPAWSVPPRTPAR